jgi:hypothetical protein
MVDTGKTLPFTYGTLGKIFLNPVRCPSSKPVRFRDRIRAVVDTAHVAAVGNALLSYPLGTKDNPSVTDYCPIPFTVCSPLQADEIKPLSAFEVAGNLLTPTR